jgi:hypothetical protein
VAYDEVTARLVRENRILRELLAIRVAGALLYADDGELQDSTAIPHIDFKRDDAEVIESKLMQRGRQALVALQDRAMEEQGPSEAQVQAAVQAFLADGWKLDVEELADTMRKALVAADGVGEVGRG